jgi:hypothetical protein
MQFEFPFDRAISARQKVKLRLIGDLDPRDWQLPSKPNRDQSLLTGEPMISASSISCCRSHSAVPLGKRVLIHRL